MLYIMIADDPCMPPNCRHVVQYIVHVYPNCDIMLIRQWGSKQPSLEVNSSFDPLHKSVWRTMMVMQDDGTM